MQIIERGAVSPVRDIARAFVAGAVLALPVAALLVLLDFPDGGTTLASFAQIFAFFLPLGLVFRLLLHGLYAYVNAGRSTDPGPRWPVLVYSRPPIAFGAFWLAFYLVLVVASGLSQGDWSP